MTSLTELRRLAEAATPGPWSDLGAFEEDGWTYGEVAGVQGAHRDGSHVAFVSLFSNRRALANAEFIAAVDPTTVLHLINRIERYRAALEEYAQLETEFGGSIARDALEQ